jgi:hypothetical protein
MTESKKTKTKKLFETYSNGSTHDLAQDETYSCSTNHRYETYSCSTDQPRIQPKLN